MVLGVSLWARYPCRVSQKQQHDSYRVNSLIRNSPHPLLGPQPWRYRLGSHAAAETHNLVGVRTNLPGQWLQCQANGSDVCMYRVLTETRNLDGIGSAHTRRLERLL